MLSTKGGYYSAAGTTSGAAAPCRQRPGRQTARIGGACKTPPCRVSQKRRVGPVYGFNHVDGRFACPPLQSSYLSRLPPIGDIPVMRRSG